MKFTSFLKNGIRGVGIYSGTVLIGLLATEDEYPGSLDHLVQEGRETLLNAARILLYDGKVIDPSTIDFLPLLQQPNKVICLDLNFKDHMDMDELEPSGYPAFFSRFNSSLIGHKAPIVRPNLSVQLGWGGALAVLIGKRGKNIPLHLALDYVIGYSIFNDVSIRDYQFRSSQWTIGKNFDNTGVFGPVLTTPDQLPRGAKELRLETRLNGKIVQQANTSHMIFDVETIIHILSKIFIINPGDVIVCGTPPGTGMQGNSRGWMEPGDVCEVEIEEIGVLSNGIIQEYSQEHIK